MWLHKENDYEWKYIGIWFEMLSCEIQEKIRNKSIQCDFSQVFITFENWISTVDMINKNLQVRNQISAIQNHQKMSGEEKKAALEKIERDRADKEKAVLEAELWCCYLNDKDELLIVK